MHPRHLARRVVDAVAAQAVWPALNLSSERLLVLTYHRILPVEYLHLPLLQPGMMTTPERLKEHIEELAPHVKFVHLDEWIERARTRRPLPQTACALTFDDGWRDFFDHALPILQDRGVPATLFVISDVIGTRRLLWPDRLARVVWNGGRGPTQEMLFLPEFDWLHTLGRHYISATRPPTQEQIDHLITKAKGFSDLDMEERLGFIENALGQTSENDVEHFLTWEQIEKAVCTGLVRIGSHGRNHRRLLEGMGWDVMEDEVRTSKVILEQRLGMPV